MPESQRTPQPSLPPPPALPREGAGPSAPGAPLGRTLGKYLLVRQLGQGGMGVVYEAQDLLLQRRVAVKLLPPALANDASALRRFLQEGQAAARLQHPNVVAIYDVDHRDGESYLVLELVAGRSAEALLREDGPLPWPEATRIVIEVCRGLAAAHAAGLVHRDIKPANLILGQSGSVKLTDFGLVQVAGRTGLTGSGEVVGTPGYMSPEQCQNETVDARSDLYSLGATYFALLTGRPPYEAVNPMQVMFAHCSSPAPDPGRLKPDIPQECAAIIQRAMAKSRRHRFASAEEMLAALEALVAPDSARLPGPRGSTARLPRLWASKRWKMAAGLGLLLAILVALVLVNFSFERESPNGGIGSATEPPAITVRLRRALPKQAGDVRCVDLTPDGRLLASAGANGVARLWDLAAGKLLHEFDGHRGQVMAVSLAPDGRWLASGGKDGAICLWETAADERPVKTEKLGDVWALAAAPNSKLLAAGTGAQLRLWDVADPLALRPREISIPATEMLYTLAFAPDGRSLAFGTWKKSVHLCDVAAGKEIAALRDLPGLVQCLSWSSDGRRLAFGDERPHQLNHGDVWLWEPGATGPPQTLLTLADRVNAVAFVPNSRCLVASGVWAGPLEVVDVSSGSKHSVPTKVPGKVRSLRVTADGKTLVSSHDDGSILIWDVVPVDAIRG